jgi:hypothetical protein
MKETKIRITNEYVNDIRKMNNEEAKKYLQAMFSSFYEAGLKGKSASCTIMGMEQ